MLISHRYQFIYFVIPKTASATLRRSLSPWIDLGWPVSQTHPQHVTVRQFLNTEFAETYRRYRKFTFVRNPYDRLYSGYLQDRFAADNYPRWAIKKPIFDAIGNDFSSYFNEYVVNADIENAWEWICFCPMKAFAVGPDGKNDMDFIGRAESLQRDIASLGRCMDIALTKADDENVRQELCSEEPKYLKHFDRRTIAAINTLYRDDFKLFGYRMLEPSTFPARSKAT